jgi:hypothetical protein
MVMIMYVRVEKGEGKRPVAVRPKAGTKKSEYCFGLDVWRGSIKRAWADSSSRQDANMPACNGATVPGQFDRRKTTTDGRASTGK